MKFIILVCSIFLISPIITNAQRLSKVMKVLLDDIPKANNESEPQNQIPSMIKATSVPLRIIGNEPSTSQSTNNSEPMKTSEDDTSDSKNFLESKDPMRMEQDTKKVEGAEKNIVSKQEITKPKEENEQKQERKPFSFPEPRQSMIYESSETTKEDTSFKSGIIGFSLTRASEESLQGVIGTVILENVFANLNNDWDKEASMFKCSIPGLYYFSFSARGLTNNKTDSWILSLVLNGIDVVAVGGKNDSSSSNNILLPLNMGDEVWLQLQRGSLVEDDNLSFTSFSGYRIGGIRPSNNLDIVEQPIKTDSHKPITNNKVEVYTNTIEEIRKRPYSSNKYWDLTNTRIKAWNTNQDADLLYLSKWKNVNDKQLSYEPQGHYVMSNNRRNFYPFYNNQKRFTSNAFINSDRLRNRQNNNSFNFRSSERNYFNKDEDCDDDDDDVKNKSNNWNPYYTRISSTPKIVSFGFRRNSSPRYRSNEIPFTSLLQASKNQQ